MTADQMPEEIWYSQKTVENNGKKYILHFVSPTETEENKTRYHIAEGFEKYLADRVDARLADRPTPAQAQGESADAEIFAIIKAYKSVAKQLGRYPEPTLSDAIQSVEWAMNNTGVIFFNYPDDGYKQAVEIIIQAARPHPADAEQLAQKFHETYERLAPAFSYTTRIESAKPWDNVPENNKRLMIAVCTEILQSAQFPAPEVVDFDTDQDLYETVRSGVTEANTSFEQARWVLDNLKDAGYIIIKKDK